MFSAYQDDGRSFSFEGRDDAVRVLGTFQAGAASPMATASSLEELEEKAMAYLGKEPGALLYLVDGENRVHRILCNKKYHDALGSSMRRKGIAVSLLLFCITCLIGASLGPLGAWALIGFVAVSVLYALILRAGFFNEIEGFVACEILLLLALFCVLFARAYP